MFLNIPNKTTRKLFIVAFAILAFTITEFAQTPISPKTPEQSGDEKMSAGQYADAIFYYKTQWASFLLGNNDSDKDTLEARARLIGKMAQAVAKMDKPPTIPEDADFHAQKGLAFINIAKTSADSANFPKAVKEFQTAVNDAPWVFDYHFNLAVAQRSANDFKSALNSLGLAKLLAVNDKDRRDLNKLRAEIEVAQETFASEKTETEKTKADAQNAANKAQEQRFVGTWEMKTSDAEEKIRFYIRHPTDTEWSVSDSYSYRRTNREETRWNVRDVRLVGPELRFTFAPGVYGESAVCLLYDVRAIVSTDGNRLTLNYTLLPLPPNRPSSCGPVNPRFDRSHVDEYTRY